MSNMSYCRFTNTVQSLQDCYDNMDAEDLSVEEQKARRALIKMCGDLYEDYEDEVR